MNTDRIQLRQVLDKRFDLEELRTLCYDLNVDFDSLRGEGKASKARELVMFMERRDRLDELVAAIASFLSTEEHPTNRELAPEPTPTYHPCSYIDDGCIYQGDGISPKQIFHRSQVPSKVTDAVPK